MQKWTAYDSLDNTVKDIYLLIQSFFYYLW